MPVIPLSRGASTVVDDCDFERFGHLKWHLSHYGYAVRNETNNTGVVYLHRAILEAPDGVDVDHASGDKLDNRRSNIRLCTRVQNLRNKPKRSGKFTSKFKGVSWHSVVGKWRARINVGGRQIVIGYFDDEQNAANAYDAAANQSFGEFARLNAA